jgi:hypothetical protein
VFNATKRRGRQMKDTMIGVDLAKSVFQLHGASLAGHLKFRKKVTRVQFRHFMASLELAVGDLDLLRASPSRPAAPCQPHEQA